MNKNKVTHLSEIKTNADRRRRKEVHEYIGDMKKIATENEVDAFVIVMWSGDAAYAYWDTESLGVLGDLRGELAKRVIHRIEGNKDTVNIVDSMVED
ncbi:MAG: hypothetical protein NXH70_02660 [Hyphomonas sp.]|nr:hypothetical protein [Hyphomonas sp.]